MAVKTMKGMVLGGVAGIAGLLMVAGVNLDASAQTPTQCKSIYHNNVTMFERMVAEQIDRGWVVKGGMYKDSGGFGVLMCSR